jgi:ribonuclease HII
VPLLAGIDEAGYGPTLGPLVVAATLWNVPRKLAKSDFWGLLSDSVRRSGHRSGDGLLVVDDSKAVYKRKQGLSALERPVLAFARAAGLDTATLGSLLAQIGARLVEATGLPWYRDLALALPTDRERSKYQGAADRLKRNMGEAGLTCCGLRAEVVPEDRFNQRVAATRNKAAVLIECVLRLIQSAAERAAGQDLVVRVDRLGGRTNYRNLLAAAFPERHIRILEVSDSRSRYRLSSGENDWFIEFAVASDEQHLPVALASMVAKYLRELLMRGFNAYWRQRLPALVPTAGYYTDARRFLGEIEAVLAETGVPRQRFVRAR